MEEKKKKKKNKGTKRINPGVEAHEYFQKKKIEKQRSTAYGIKRTETFKKSDCSTLQTKSVCAHNSEFLDNKGGKRNGD